jgi:hypothetical protein
MGAESIFNASAAARLAQVICRIQGPPFVPLSRWALNAAVATLINVLTKQEQRHVQIS